MTSRKMSRSTVPDEAPQQRLSEMEVNQAAGLLSRAIKFGQQAMIAKQMCNHYCSKATAISAQAFMENVSAGSDSAVGSMTDASKRQRDPAEEALQECWEHDMAASWGLISSEPEFSPTSAVRGQSASYNGPIPSYVASSGGYEPPMPGASGLNFTFGDEDTRVPLPPDVASVQEWARSELELDKVRHLKLCYGEFVQKAETDPQLRGYANFMMESFGPFVVNKKTQKYTKGVDFAFFLTRIKFDPKVVSRGLSFRRSIRQ